jgi:hypothetical protein
MKKLLVMSAIGASILVPAIASAQTAPTGNAWVCRAATASEKPNATLGSTGLTCRAIDTAKMNAAWTKMRSAMGKMNASDPAMSDVKSAMTDMESLLMPVIERGGNG